MKSVAAVVTTLLLSFTSATEIATLDLAEETVISLPSTVFKRVSWSLRAVAITSSSDTISAATSAAVARPVDFASTVPACHLPAPVLVRPTVFNAVVLISTSWLLTAANCSEPVLTESVGRFARVTVILPSVSETAETYCPVTAVSVTSSALIASSAVLAAALIDLAKFAIYVETLSPSTATVSLPAVIGVAATPAAVNSVSLIVNAPVSSTLTPDTYLPVVAVTSLTVCFFASRSSILL